LSIVRIGTSGALQPDIAIDSFVLSSYGMDINGMLQSYNIESIKNNMIEQAFVKHTKWSPKKPYPVIVSNSKSLETHLSSNETFKGMTATCGGFYGPQGRVLRLELQDDSLNNKMDSFDFKGLKVTNFEMETSAIYGLSKLLGHEACSINAILANRALGTFSKNPQETIDKLIVYTLNKLIS
jgi:uridine phosphorylase